MHFSYFLEALCNLGWLLLPNILEENELFMSTTHFLYIQKTFNNLELCFTM